MKRYSSGTAVPVFLLFLLLHSCAVSDTVVTKHYSDQAARSKHLSHVGDVHWSFLWGLVKRHDWPAGCQDGSNMSRVRVTTNPGFVMVSFLSLGIAVPQRLEWDCSPPCRTTGTLGN